MGTIDDAMANGMHLEERRASMERTFYRGTAPGETQRIPEVFTAAEGKTFVARQASSARNYGESIESIVARPDAKILREEDAAFWKLIGRRKPANGWIGSATRKGETVIDAVNDAIRKAEKAGYDIISFSQDADMGTVILNEGAVTRQAKSPLTLRPDGTLRGVEPRRSPIEQAQAVVDKAGTATPTPAEITQRAIEQAEAETAPPKATVDMDRQELQAEAKRLGVSQRGLTRNLRERIDRAAEGERTRARQFIQTMQNQTGLPQGAMDELSKVDPQTYEQTKTGEVFQKSRQWLDESPNNVELAREYVNSSSVPSAAKGAVFAALIDKYQTDGNFEAERDTVEAYDIQLRESGRFVQAASLVANMTGKGFMLTVDKFLTNHKVKTDSDVLEDVRQEYVNATHLSDETARNDAVGAVVERVAAMAPTTWKDWIGSFRYFNMLSNPQSHERNIAGNLFETLVARPAALLGQGKGTAALQYEWTSLKSLPNAFKAFQESWRSGNVNQRWMETSAKWRNQFETERTRQGAKKSKVAQGMLSIGRFLEAQDKFFAAMIESGETARLLKDGVDPAEAQKLSAEMAQDLLYRTQIGAQMTDKNKALLVRALDSAGHLMENARKHKFIGPAASWFLPFVRTPINIGKKMVEFSPLGYLRAPKGKLSIEDIGRANAGSVVTMIGAVMAMAGQTTGAPPKDPQERRLWYDTGRRPWSVFLGGKWIPMWYFGPFAGALAIPAATRDAFVDDPAAAGSDVPQKLLKVSGGLVNFFSSQTPLAGASTFLDVATGRTDFSTEGAIAFTGGQFVPASGFLRWANGLMLDPVYRRGGSFKESVMKDYPFLSKNARPYVDSKGKPVKREAINSLIPFAIGNPKEENESALETRRKSLRMRNKNNRELDRLVKKAVFGDIDIEQVHEWIRAQPVNSTEKDRLRNKIQTTYKQWGKRVES